MPSDQANTNGYITQAAAKAARVEIQTMWTVGTGWAENVEPRMSGLIIKQPTFERSVKDKYAKLRNFKLEVKTCSKT